jgi:YVTN family beta-propeller protein
MVVATSAHAAATVPAYGIVDRFVGNDGWYDYISFDETSHQIFIGRSTGVMKIDLAARKVTNDFIKGSDVAAVLIIPGTPLMLSTNSTANTATLFDRRTGVIKGHVPTGKSPDGAIYDSVSGLAFVMNADSKDLTLIDIAAVKAVATIPVGGKPEAAASDGKGNLYVNIEDTAEIAVVDVKARKVARRYQLSGCEEPTGIAYDARTGTLISACQNKVAKLIDATNGSIKADMPIASGADGVIVDAQRRLVYIPCQEGVLAMFQLSTQGAATALPPVPTKPRARTAALDPETGRLYLPVNRRVKDTKGEWAPEPGSFEVLVVAPSR